MQIINKSQLKQSIDPRQDMLLVDVLPKESFDQQHIPGSVNVPVKDNANFTRDVENRAKSKTQRIVVYCSNTACDYSQTAAEQLEKAGFSNVFRFEEGVEGWFGTKAAAA